MKEQADGRNNATESDTPAINQTGLELVELLLASELTDDDNMTWEELAQLLGVAINEEGEFDGVVMFNACLSAQSNPALQALSLRERVRVIKSAGDAMDSLWSK